MVSLLLTGEVVESTMQTKSATTGAVSSGNSVILRSAAVTVADPPTRAPPVPV